MATIPPRKRRLGWREGVAEMERVGGAMGFAWEKDVGGEERRMVEKMGLEQIGVEVVLRMVKLMAMLLCSEVTFTDYIIAIYSPFSLSTLLSSFPMKISLLESSNTLSTKTKQVSTYLENIITT